VTTTGGRSGFACRWAAMPADRVHDVTGMTSPELQRARRDLQVSLSLAMPGSAIREPILAHMSAIDVELERRTGWDYRRQPHGIPAQRGLEGKPPS
jgi:hypothetical protein